MIVTLTSDNDCHTLTCDNECDSVADCAFIAEEALECCPIVGCLGLSEGQGVVRLTNINQLIVVVVEGQSVSQRVTGVVGSVDPEVWFFV